MIGWLAETLGRAAKDIVTGTEEILDDVASVGERFEKGYDEGLVTSNKEEKTSSEQNDKETTEK